jgi:hypothetical protein
MSIRSPVSIADSLAASADPIVSSGALSGRRVRSVALGATQRTRRRAEHEQWARLARYVRSAQGGTELISSVLSGEPASAVFRLVVDRSM